MKRLPKSTPYLLAALVAVVFGWFIMHHPEIGRTLKHTNFWLLSLAVVCYLLMIVCLVWAYDVLLRICGHRLKPGDNFMLTAYSSIVNFFGPLQSGPGVRAAYLKKKHQVPLKRYGIATLRYYAVYAVLSASLLLVGSGRYWLLGLLDVLGAGLLSWLVIRWAQRRGPAGLTITPRLLLELTAATGLQLATIAAAYAVELQAVQASINLPRLLAYAGAANFALFVSLTPGAIGFREAFLAFSQKLHHVPVAKMLAASVIDRTAFVLMLAILFVIVLARHSWGRLTIKD